MVEIDPISDIGAALKARQFPTVTLWNRLEGRPRTSDFARALRAEVRDPLWMLTRQWQLGEFKGDDAGSPIFTQLHARPTALTKYRARNGAARPFRTTVPLEAEVERKSVPLELDGTRMALDLRLTLGRRWLKLVSTVGDYRKAFIDGYGFTLPDPSRADHAAIAGHVETHQLQSTLAERAMDGFRLVAYLRGGPLRHAYDGITVDELDKPAIDELAQRFLPWALSLLLEPVARDDDAWDPSRFEYSFACSLPATNGGERVFVGEGYHHGHLDWYSVDAGSEPSLGDVPEASSIPQPPPVDLTVLAAPVTFEGMPDSRYWAFEDSRINFGEVRPDKTDLARVLLLEFTLVYANDWVIVPLTLPVGTVTEIRGLAVTTVFGERFWIERAGSRESDGWQRFALFQTSHAGDDSNASSPGLMLLPTAPQVMDGSTVEEALLVRDETANMVWAIEKRIPLATGGTKPGGEAAQETLAYHGRLAAERIESTTGGPIVPDPRAAIRYRLMKTVPEHWIPYVPVHVPSDNRSIQLQRAGLPRVFDGDPAPVTKVRPRTSLLRTGLDTSPLAPHFLHEEEVPRAGAHVTQSFQRTRWYDGKTVVWFGAKKATGRGEASSNLAFDRLTPTKFEAGS